MSYIGQTLPADTFQGFTTDSFTGDGSATTFTLSKTPFNESALLVVINNVIQKPVTNFTVSGTTLTIVGDAVASGDVIYATHIGGALPIGQAASLDLNGASDQLILDADADTTISADTDDQIDFKAGGTDIFQLTATTATFNDGVTITTADNTDTLTLKSTDADANAGPILVLNRDSASPADGDSLGALRFAADDDAGNSTNFFAIESFIRDASNGSEDVQMVMYGMSGGSTLNIMEFDTTGGGVDAGPEVVFNDGSSDIDFRVEGNGDANAFFVEGSTDHIGMGTNDPDSPLHVHVGSAGSVTAFDTSGVTIEDSDNACINMLSPDSGTGRILFGSPSDNVGASIKWNYNSNAFEIKGGTGSSELQLGGAQSTQLLINNGGNVGIGTTSPGARLDVEKSANTYVMRVVNTNSTPYGLRVNYTDGPDNSDNQFFEGDDENATRFRVLADGDVKNHDNSYGSLSDERIKQDIRDSNSQWDDIKAVKVRNFKKKDDVRQYGDKAWEQIGVIAQELETVSPKLIRKHNPSSCDIISSSEFGTLYEDGDTIPEGKKIGDVKEIKEQVKGVSYSVLYMKAIKALQEAMAKIEALETSNTDLKNRVTALEG